VGCGVCDTPELWRGAAGLCARVRVCAGAAECICTYTYICSDTSTRASRTYARTQAYDHRSRSSDRSKSSACGRLIDHRQGRQKNVCSRGLAVAIYVYIYKEM